MLCQFCLLLLCCFILYIFIIGNEISDIFHLHCCLGFFQILHFFDLVKWNSQVSRLFSLKFSYGSDVESNIIFLSHCLGVQPQPSPALVEDHLSLEDQQQGQQILLALDRAPL